MEQISFEARRPDFSSRNGINIWKKKDRNGNEYLSVSIPLLNIKDNCFAPFDIVKEEKVV